MKTPICDFAERYLERNAIRLHMPGHKGVPQLGAEPRDITEIKGADDLYHAKGIIRESEDNASLLFGSAKTVYSTEGSSLCIRAMLLLIKLFAESRGEKPLVLAARNAHKSFLSAVALLDIDVEWLFSKKDTLLSCHFALDECEKLLKEKKITALYITSPDYLGNIADIERLSALCRKYGALLAVDNAHGAYLKFLPTSLHPIDLGADICCDSAHKTLPVLTGGAYLHIAKSAPPLFSSEAENALSIFASTSPSYLILQSLDYANRLLSETLPASLYHMAKAAESLRQSLSAAGYTLTGNEPMKLTISAKPYGYRGFELADYLEGQNIVCEFCDPDFVVLMLSSETTMEDISRLEKALTGLPKKRPISEKPPHIAKPLAVMPPSKAMLAVGELTPIEKAEGRILAAPSVSCPPAIPILISGEKINKDAIRCFAYYGIESCRTVKE